MLETYLLDHKWVLVGSTILLAGINMFVVAAAQRAFASQESFKQEAHAPPGLGGQLTKNAVGRAVGQLSFVVLVLAIALSLDRSGFAAFAGGLLVAQGATILMSLGSLLNFRALRRPGAVAGQVTYSAVYRYTLTANQYSACAALVWLAFALRGGRMLLGGGVILMATAIGFYRRARQVRALSDAIRQKEMYGD
jgi:hypothetical protein